MLWTNFKSMPRILALTIMFATDMVDLDIDAVRTFSVDWFLLLAPDACLALGRGTRTR